MKSLHHGAIERLKRDMDSISRAGWPSVHRRLQAEHYLPNAIISRLVTRLEQSKSQQLHDRIIEGASACHFICAERDVMNHVFSDAVREDRKSTRLNSSH